MIDPLDIIRRFKAPARAALEMRALGTGHINDTYLMGGGACVLQRLNPNVFRDGEHVMANMERVCAHLQKKLRARGLSSAQMARRALRLFPTEDGGSFFRDREGALWRCMNYVSDARVYARAQTPERAYAGAFAYGEFARMLADLPPPALHETVPHFHDTPARLMAFRTALMTDAHRRAREAKDAVDAALAHAPLAGRLAAEGFKPCIVHNDTKLNNVLFDNAGERALCVVDLDTVMPGLPLHDFGDLARSAAGTADEDEADLSKVGVDANLYAALKRGYADGIGDLLEPRAAACFDLAAMTVAYELGLRFLTDFLEGDSYFKTDYPRQNLVRARVQFRLAECFLRLANPA